MNRRLDGTMGPSYKLKGISIDSKSYECTGPKYVFKWINILLDNKVTLNCMSIVGNPGSRYSNGQIELRTEKCKVRDFAQTFCKVIAT